MRLGKLHNEVPRELYSSPNFASVTGRICSIYRKEEKTEFVRTVKGREHTYNIYETYVYIAG
jgi:hypothetical protein